MSRMEAALDYMEGEIKEIKENGNSRMEAALDYLEEEVKEIKKTVVVLAGRIKMLEEHNIK